MHEMSLMKGLIRQLEEMASREGARAVTSIRLRLGALSHFSAGHFREHFDRVAPGTVAQGASLEIHTSEDVRDPHAQDVVIESIEVELDGEPPARPG